MSKSKVLQDMNLNLKGLTVTFTTRTIQMSCVFFFSCGVCSSVLFFILFSLFNVIRKQMYLSCCPGFG